MDLVNLLLGSLFWGTLFSSFLVGGLFGGIAFGIVWQVGLICLGRMCLKTMELTLLSLLFQATAIFAQKAFATIIGTYRNSSCGVCFVCVCVLPRSSWSVVQQSSDIAGIVTIIILKVLIFGCLNRRWFLSFYRTRPFAANVMALTLDWANFALSIGFVMARIVKLTLAAVLFVGKIDTPLLVKSPVLSKLDKIPDLFLKDIMFHEAHRHPYIEQLGAIYLMKLRYRGDFGKDAGTNWRLLFIYALMPWMSRYRIQSSDGSVDASNFTASFNDGSRVDVSEYMMNSVDNAEMEALNLIDQITQQRKIATVRMVRSVENYEAEAGALEDYVTTLKKELNKVKRQNNPKKKKRESKIKKPKSRKSLKNNA